MGADDVGCCVHSADVSEDTFEWGSIRWLVNGSAVAGAGITVGLVQILPGKKTPLHLHPNTEEVLHLLDGTLRHRIGPAAYDLVPGSTIFVPAGTPHDARNTGPGVARMLVSYPTGERQMVVLEEPAP